MKVIKEDCYIIDNPEDKEAFDMAIQALSQEPCTDAVSREDALKLIYDFKEKHTEDREKHPINYGTLLDLIRLIRELPSVTQKSGKWIIIDDCEKFIAKCSECGRIEDSRMIGKYPYCHCGAKMESEDKE